MNNSIKNKIVILSAPIHSGSSTALMEWIISKSVCGFTTPKVNEKKRLWNLQTGESFIYEKVATDSNTVEIGNYFLCNDAFKKARQIYEEAIKAPAEWLVIDEIGKLELLEKGHHSILIDAIEHWKHNILIVVRDTLLQEVIKKYSIRNPIVIDKTELKNLI